MSGKPTHTKRRWRQFTLRGLLVLTTLIVLLLVGWRIYIEPYRQQHRVMALIKELRGNYSTEQSGPQWLQSLLGKKSYLQNVTRVDFVDCDSPDRYVSELRRLPKLRNLAVGRNFGDAELERVKQLPELKLLILQSPRVSDAAMRAFISEFPHIKVLMGRPVT